MMVYLYHKRRIELQSGNDVRETDGVHAFGFLSHPTTKGLESVAATCRSGPF